MTTELDNFKKWHKQTKRYMGLIKEVGKIKIPDTCKQCGANRELLFQGMREGYESDNAQHAIKIIKNCQACKKAYIKNLDELCKNIAY